MTAVYSGPERRQMTQEELVKKAVKEAVAEALKGANLIDGPTHILHHQEFENWIQAKRLVGNVAVKVTVTAFVVGLLGMVAIGFLEWVRK